MPLFLFFVFFYSPSVQAVPVSPLDPGANPNVFFRCNPTEFARAGSDGFWDYHLNQKGEMKVRMRVREIEKDFIRNPEKTSERMIVGPRSGAYERIFKLDRSEQGLPISFQYEEWVFGNFSKKVRQVGVQFAYDKKANLCLIDEVYEEWEGRPKLVLYGRSVCNRVTAQVEGYRQELARIEKSKKLDREEKSKAKSSLSWRNEMAFRKWIEAAGEVKEKEGKYFDLKVPRNPDGSFAKISIPYFINFYQECQSFINKKYGEKADAVQVAPPVKEEIAPETESFPMYRGVIPPETSAPAADGEKIDSPQEAPVSFWMRWLEALGSIVP